MRLDGGGVLGLGQDLQQLVIRQEVEPGEGRPLGLQVLAEPLLDLVQELVALLQVVQETGIRAEGDHLEKDYNHIMIIIRIIIAFKDASLSQTTSYL